MFGRVFAAFFVALAALTFVVQPVLAAKGPQITNKVRAIEFYS